MTTTDGAAERLARLQARRSGATTDTAEQPSTTSDPHVGAAAPRRRRSPALSAKVMTVGASTTAVLGMMAGYGIAEGRAEQAPTPAPDPVAEPDRADIAAPAAAVPTTLAASTTVPPQVIVVVVDGRTGERIDTDALAQAAVDGDLAAATTAATAPASPAAAPTVATADPTPVTAPAPVAVAVDVPTPEPAPAPAPAAAPAPRPEASSGGS